MDDNKLRPDLQSIIDQFINLTTDHYTLQKSLTAQEEINNSLNMASKRAQKQLDTLIPQVEKFIEFTKNKLKEQKIRIRHLEDEIEIIQCENSLTEERHREEMNNLTRNHEEEIKRLQLTVESQKKSIAKLAVQAKKNSNFDHPALQTPFKPPKKTKAKKLTAQAFNWPNLDIEVSQQKKKSSEEVVMKKKRKLYTPNDEIILDIDINNLSDSS